MTVNPTRDITRGTGLQWSQWLGKVISSAIFCGGNFLRIPGSMPCARKTKTTPGYIALSLMDRAASQIIELIYSTILEPEKWEDVLALVVNSTRARGGIFSVEDRSMPEILTFQQHGYTEGEIGHYVNEMFVYDEWVDVLASYDRGRFLSSDLHCFPYKKYRETVLFNEWGKETGVHHSTGTLINVTNTHEVRFALQGDRQRGHFNERDLAFLDTLRPHLNQAVRVASRLQESYTQQLSATTLMDSQNAGLLLVNEKGHALQINKLGHELLEDAHFPLFVAQDLLVGSNEILQAFIDQMLQRLAGGLTVSDTLTILSGHDYAPWLIEASTLQWPVNILGTTLRGKGVSFTIRPANLLDDADGLGKYLKARYGLTPGEVDCVYRLCQGQSIQEIANQRKAQVSTVRTQFKSIFSKTDARSQVELLNLLKT